VKNTTAGPLIRFSEDYPDNLQINLDQVTIRFQWGDCLKTNGLTGKMKCGDQMPRRIHTGITQALAKIIAQSIISQPLKTGLIMTIWITTGVIKNLNKSKIYG